MCVMKGWVSRWIDGWISEWIVHRDGYACFCGVIDVCLGKWLDAGGMNTGINAG